MLRKFSALPLAAFSSLFTPALAADPLYDPNPGHPWDQARDVFYVRRFPTGETFEHPHAFAPPWTEYLPFVHDGAFHERVLARLDAVEKLPPAELEGQPAARRFIFLRDLWPAFDGLVAARVTLKDDAAGSAVAALRRDELLRRLARIMRRLELTEAEALALPNALRVIADAKLYSTAFDPAAPRQPFVPIDLLDNDGPWIAYSRQQAPSAGGEFHSHFVRNRSLFTLHLRTPGARDGATKFFQDYAAAKGKLAVPPGSTLALLRRALVPTREGKLVASPFVESLQLIVVAPPLDHHFKFTLDRAEHLAGRPALKPLGKDDPVDTSSDEASTFHRMMATDPAAPAPSSESLVAQQFKTLREVPSSLSTCVRCHGATIENNVITFGPPANGAFPRPDPAAVAAALVKQKESGGEWKLYLRLRDPQGQ